MQPILYRTFSQRFSFTAAVSSLVESARRIEPIGSLMESFAKFAVGNLRSLPYIYRSKSKSRCGLYKRFTALERSENVSGKGRTSYEQTYVRTMFDGIARRYDLLNHLLSSGIDILWRKKAIRLLKIHSPKVVLDVATGTADLAIEAAKLSPEKIVGIDISQEMLKLGRKKISRHRLDAIITLEEGPAEHLRYPDASFDAAMAAFGVRNFSDLEQGLSEMYRVLRPGGVAMILEFSQPRTAPFKQLYGFYFRRVLPVVGGIISKNREAYTYLPSTVSEFPDGEQFRAILKATGFSRIQLYPLTFGIATIYLAIK